MIEKIPWPINFHIKNCLPAPISSLVIKGLTWRLQLPVMCPTLRGPSQSSPSGCLCLCVSWCSSQLAHHASEHPPCRDEYAQTCLSDFCNCTVASLSHLTTQVLVQKCAWISVCVHASLLDFVHANHITAPSLRGVHFPKK